VLRSQEIRAASFWRGYENEANDSSVVASVLESRIVALYYGDGASRPKKLDEICKMFAMSDVAVWKIIRAYEVKKNAPRKKYRADKSRQANADRKAAIKRRHQNYLALHHDLME